MAARFIGALGSPDPAAGSARQPEGMASLAFPGGFLAHDAGLSVFHAHGWLCLAVGEPRFLDPHRAAVSASQGAAAAWLEAFLADGHSAPAGALGRFAVVALSPERNEAWLATDRFATWPLCYTMRDGALAFADRADAVPDRGDELSPQAIFDYLYFHVIPAPTTVFDGVARLPGGHVLHWSQGKAECQPWWTPRFAPQPGLRLDEAKRRFLEIVQDAVAREALGFEAGAFLSGGTDSSTVSGMLGKVLGRPARTFSIGFDAAGYDEMEYARIAARHFGTDHHEYYVTPDDLLDAIPRVATHYDQPFGNSSAAPAWICARRARDAGIDKLLAGDGGDELFGGNTRYAKQRVFGWYENIPAALRRGLIEPVAALPGLGRVPLVKKGVSYVEQARVPMPDRIQMYNMIGRLGPTTVFEPHFLAAIDTGHPLAMQRETWQVAETGSLVDRMLAFDWKYTLADNDLPKVVGTTGLAGVEVGFPLLADELLDFSATLSPQWKLRGLTLRWFFKEALRGFLPDAIIAKKKHGFGLPFGVWACRHDGLKALAGDALASFATRGIVRPDFIRALLDRHLPEHPGYYGEMVWILIMMELWMQAHAPDYRHQGMSPAPSWAF